MSRKIVLVRHGDDPPDDRVVTYAVQSGFEPVFRRPFKGDKLGLPDPDVAGVRAQDQVADALKEVHCDRGDRVRGLLVHVNDDVVAEADQLLDSKSEQEDRQLPH